MTRTLEESWAETFAYARERSPFYRELLRPWGSVPPLDEVPTVDKQVLSERNLDFLCVPRERIVELVTTSGTTGQPLLWMLTESDLRRLSANERLSFEGAGLTAEDTVLVAVAMDRCFIAGQAYCGGLRELGCTVVRVGAGSPMLVLDMVQRVQPTAIVAVPSFLRVIAEKARAAGINLRHSTVGKAVCIGEPIRDRTFALNVSGRRVEEEWGARAYSTYGVTELANGLCECGAGRGGHLHDQMLHLEILDEAGRPVPDGEVGEVVATTFGVEAMPLIRYRTGDCATLHREPCPCGQLTPRLGPILDRKNHKLKFKGASLFPSTLQAVLEQAAGIDSYVILARKENELSDAVEVLVHGSANLEHLQEALQARSKISPALRLATADEIEAWQSRPPARKRRTFVDLR